MRRDTRARILDVAQRRFTEDGYDGTSLREIADELGVTKAALYYHFQSKDQMLAALLEPADDLIRELLDRLDQAKGTEGWAAALEWVIDAMEQYLDFFQLVQRNHTAIENLEAPLGFLKEHQQMHERVEQALFKASDRLDERIRMIAALGAVTGFDDWAPSLLSESPVDEIRIGLKSVVARILGPDHRD